MTSMSVTGPLGLAHLTILDASPPDWVTLAAETGFDAVGIRAAATGPTEEPWSMHAGSPLLAQTLQRMDDTGVIVNDVELILLVPDTDPSAHRRLFETGARLGARFVNLMSRDADIPRVRDNIATIVGEAEPFGLRPVLEPMVFMGVSNLEQGVAAVEGTGAGLIMDPLHLRRFGATPADLATIDPELLPYYQICDAPLTAPESLPVPERLPRGQSTDCTVLQLESRAVRLLPGEGELPLVDYVRNLPSGVPISVESPNVHMIEQLGRQEFGRRARRALAGILAAAELTLGESVGSS